MYSYSSISQKKGIDSLLCVGDTAGIRRSFPSVVCRQAIIPRFLWVGESFRKQDSCRTYAYSWRHFLRSERVKLTQLSPVIWEKINKTQQLVRPCRHLHLCTWHPCTRTSLSKAGDSYPLLSKKSLIPSHPTPSSPCTRDLIIYLLNALYYVEISFFGWW